MFFFFQAEDGIRDVAVTGVQTCALPIYRAVAESGVLTRRLLIAIKHGSGGLVKHGRRGLIYLRDRKSTRLNSSHGYISYAVFCLKKKKTLLRLHVHELLRHPQARL